METFIPVTPLCTDSWGLPLRGIGFNASPLRGQGMGPNSPRPSLNRPLLRHPW
jgi:hypothetical protein